MKKTVKYLCIVLVGVRLLRKHHITVEFIASQQWESPMRIIGIACKYLDALWWEFEGESVKCPWKCEKKKKIFQFCGEMWCVL